ncbi:MAG TPA: hypothetical protein VIK48_02540, partial [Candidatus Manganitrophaceae bacterium]
TRWRGEGEFDPPARKLFEVALRALIALLDQERFLEAREWVNRRLIQYWSKANKERPGLLSPIRVRFDNRRSPQWTLLDIHGQDTPGFLYAFSNALTLRGIYSHKVKIHNVGSKAHDRFYISDRRGKKITGEKDQRALKLSAVLIKQFTHYLNRAPDPARAIGAFDQLIDKIMEKGVSPPLISFLKKDETLTLLARLFGASEFLWEDFLRAQFEALLPVLERFKNQKLRRGRQTTVRELRRRLRAAKSFDDKKRILNQYKDREMFRIDMAHLLDPAGTLEEFSNALTDLAEAAIDQAYRICDDELMKQEGAPFTDEKGKPLFSICGLGKFGGREMGYASDIELLFVFGRPGKGRREVSGEAEIDHQRYFEKLSQRIVQFIEARQEGIFHIDTRLRPYGSSGLLAVSWGRFTAYYSLTGGAAPFERQALIKLRRAAGSASLGRKIEAYRDRFVYSGEPWDLRTALELRERQKKELVPPGKVNVKYGAGGILDIEYAAQYLQIAHGSRFPELKTPNTLQALDNLYRFGIIAQKRWKRLRESYLFLRRLIDALRIVRGNAKDLILPERASEEFAFLARRLGYGQRDWEKGKRELAKEIERRMAGADEVFTSLFAAG